MSTDRKRVSLEAAILTVVCRPSCSDSQERRREVYVDGAGWEDGKEVVVMFQGGDVMLRRHSGVLSRWSFADASGMNPMKPAAGACTPPPAGP